MTDLTFNSEPLVYKDLPKEQQKALRKEFSLISNSGRNIIIISIIFAIVLIVLAISGFFVENWIFSGILFPACILPVFVAMDEEKFAKWLKNEKNMLFSVRRKK